MAAIATGLIRLIGALIGTLLLKKFKRKLLMISSACLMAFVLGMLATTVYFKDKIQQGQFQNPPREGLVFALSILPLVEIILYILFFGFGVGTVPWLLLGELCPVRVKGLTSGVVACTAFGTVFILVKLFPMMLLGLGQHGTYFLFAMVCLLMAVFTHFFVPETR
jgi:hypothetical protein